MAEKYTAKDVTRALYRHFTPRWCVLTEVTARAQRRPTPAPVLEVLGKQFTTEPPPPPATDRRIDVLMLRTAGGGIERMAIEIKVTRGDYLNDVRDPAKQAPWRGLAHRHAYAVPEGLVSVNELPPNSGLLVVKRVHDYRAGQYHVTWARQAKRPEGHTPDDLPLANIMDAFWRTARAEAALKGHGFDLDDRSPEELRAEVKQLRHELGLAGNRLKRQREIVEMWKQAFGAVGRPPCSTCGQPLKPDRKQRGYGVDWTHADPAHNGTCDKVRRDTAVAEATQDGRTADQLHYLYVPKPEPAEVPDPEKTPVISNTR